MIIPNFYPYHPNAGGAERQCLKLSQELVKNGVDIDVLTYRLRSEWATHEEIDGIKIRRLPYFVPNELNLPVWFYYLWKNRNNYDIFHVHLFNGAHFVAASWIARIYAKPIIVKIANSGENFDVISTRKLRWPLRAWVFQSLLSSTNIVAISKSIRKELQNLNITERQIISIPNGVELIGQTQDSIKYQQRNILGIPKDATVILTVGSLTPKKGMPYLLDAWDQIRHKFPNALLVNVGGKELPAYCQQANENPDSQVKFYLNQPEGVLPFLQSADIFILPSLAEGLSNALLEAQSCGLPCIATRVGGNPDIISDGVNGILIEPRSVDQIVNSLDILISSHELRITYGKNAVLKSREYDIGHIAKKYIELYHLLIKTMVYR
jgi:glycosyltransferase involved in cell wall biosynthesis